MAVDSYMGVARIDNTVVFHAAAGYMVQFGVATPMSNGAATMGLLPSPLAID